MPEILYILGGLIVAAITVVLIIAALKPDKFTVQRSAVIQVPADRVHPLINDFHNWPQWSPWEKLDPSMNRTHSGAEHGVGAIYEWQGNKKVGKGRMEILESLAPAKVVIKLDFIQPWEAHNRTEFTLTPEGSGTKVHWSMVGSQPFMFKVMSTFMNLDRMIGKDFEAGLAAMKAVAEK